MKTSKRQLVDKADFQIRQYPHFKYGNIQISKRELLDNAVISNNTFSREEENLIIASRTCCTFSDLLSSV